MINVTIFGTGNVGLVTESWSCKQLYVPLNQHHEKIVVMDVRSADLTQYANNAMLATNISLMNEMAKPFGNPYFPAVKPAQFDVRHMYKPAVVDAAGPEYYGVGRGRFIAALGSRAS